MSDETTMLGWLILAGIVLVLGIVALLWRVFA